ncbi:MAG: rhodoquinone biosynthesis methyltransferase RquA [Pseudomonadota bacterium]
MTIQKFEPANTAAQPSRTTHPPLPPVATTEEGSPALPEYLVRIYSWAYLHPLGIRVFERQWLVNWILWGNFRRLRNAALNEVSGEACSRVLQVACVYGDFSEHLLARLGPASRLDVVDVAPAQLRNLSRKLAPSSKLYLHRQDSTRLKFDDDGFDTVVLFFLLHEQPAVAKRQSLAQALRVLKPGGRLVVVDYHKASRFNPVGHLMAPVFATLEPFAAELCEREIPDWAPASAGARMLSKETFFGGLYQKVVLTR